MSGVSATRIQEPLSAHLIDPTRRWYNNGRLIALHTWLVLILITSFTTGYDGSMMNGLQSLSQWKSTFNHPFGARLGLLNAIQNVGALASYPFAPYLSDGVGRRRAIWIGAAIMSTATVIQTASQSLRMFIAARFLIGFGNTFSSNAAPMLITELAYPPYRASLTSLYPSLWYSGSIVAAWVTFGSFRIHSTWAWRLPSLLQGLPSFIQVLLILFAPESPRWLVSKGREAEALRTLAYYHADGNEQDPVVQFEFKEIRAALEFDRTIAANVGWRSLFVTSGNRKRMRIIIATGLFTQWSGNGLLSYYLSQILNQIGVTNSNTQLLINGLLQTWSFVGALYASYTVDRHGRRPLILTSCVLMLLTYVVQAICFAEYAQHGTRAAGHAVIVFVFLYSSAYALTFTPLAISYTVEILPFNLRAKGLCILNFVTSIALVFNQYLNPIALDALGWKYYVVYVCWITCEGVFLWLFVVETKNQTLEETTALFDGVDAVKHIKHNATTGDIQQEDGLAERSAMSQEKA